MTIGSTNGSRPCGRRSLRNRGATGGAATLAAAWPTSRASKPHASEPRLREHSDSDRSAVLIAPRAARRCSSPGSSALVVVGFSGGGTRRAQAALEAAGCTSRYPGVSREHITDPNARPKSWNSFPPTSGPHYYVPAVYGFYTQPLQLARVLHNLEHGGVYMLYGSKMPSDTSEKLRAIYDRDPRGLVVAPLPELGKTIALGAWTSPNPGSAEVGTGHLAKCTVVNEKAFDAFIKAFRGRGPEGEPLNALQPGGI